MRTKSITSPAGRKQQQQRQQPVRRERAANTPPRFAFLIKRTLLPLPEAAEKAELYAGISGLYAGVNLFSVRPVDLAAVWAGLDDSERQEIERRWPGAAAAAASSGKGGAA